MFSEQGLVVDVGKDAEKCSIILSAGYAQIPVTEDPK